MKLNRLQQLFSLLFSLFGFASAYNCEAQEYFKKYSSIDNLSYLAEIEMLDDGNLLYSRIKDSETLGRDTLILTKLDPCGNVVFAHKYHFDFDQLYSSDFHTQVLKIGPTGHPYLVLAGQDMVNRNLLLLKFSKDASSIVWAKSYCCISSVEEVYITDDSNIYIGQHPKSSIFLNYPKILKIDSSGNVLNYIQLNNHPSTDDYFFYFNEENTFLFYHHNTLKKLDLGGNIIWNKSYSEISEIVDIIEDTNNGYILAGSHQSISHNTQAYHINNDGEVIKNGSYFKNFEASQLFKSSDKTFISGRSETPSSSPYFYFGHIYQLTDNPNPLLGYYQTDYSYAYYSDLEYVNNDLYYISYTFNPSDYNQLSMVTAKVSIDSTNYFCNDGVLFDTDSSIAVTSSDLSLAANGITNLSLTADNLNYTVFPASFVSDSMCFLPRDYSSLFTTHHYTMCKGDFLDITRPEIYGTSFSWSTGDTSETIRVYQEGTYWANITFPCDDSVYTDTVYVTFYPQADSNIVVTPNAAELNETIEFSSSSRNDSVFWKFQDGYATSEFNFSRSFENSGWKPFYVSFFTSDGCETIIHDSTLILFQEISVPNVFTPNGDGLNDEMFIKGEGITSFELQIFDRWGSVVVELQNEYWNGLSKSGNPCPDGVYFYIFTYSNALGEQLTKKGNVTLMRDSP